MTPSPLRGHTCPWWFAWTFDNPLRRLAHDPAAILAGLVRPGDTVVDVGCGLGFFTIAMAGLVGAGGKVVAVDLQQEMLARARRRAERRGLTDRIEFHQCAPDRIGIAGPVDFVLAFWMVHEVADRHAFLREIRTLLRPGGHLLIAEPRGHVPPALFERITAAAGAAGFTARPGPEVRFSRSLLCTPAE
jgi:ubiquinone/menaquinone biosynthesis C-methylase UbiE